MYECKYLMMQKVGYWWDILYDGGNNIILSCELCIVESLLENACIHSHVESFSEEHNRWGLR